MSKKPKPATVGEKIVLRRVRETLGPKTMTLEEFRTRSVLGHCRREAKDHDAAIRRAVKKERERCSRIAKQAFDGDIDAGEAWVNIANGKEQA